MKENDDIYKFHTPSGTTESEMLIKNSSHFCEVSEIVVQKFKNALRIRDQG